MSLEYLPKYITYICYVIYFGIYSKHNWNTSKQRVSGFKCSIPRGYLIFSGFLSVILSDYIAIQTKKYPITYVSKRFSKNDSNVISYFGKNNYVGHSFFVFVFLNWFWDTGIKIISIKNNISFS